MAQATVSRDVEWEDLSISADSSTPNDHHPSLAQGVGRWEMGVGLLLGNKREVNCLLRPYGRGAAL